MTKKTLDELFFEALENANKIPKESVPADLQLVLYGYYKKGLSENINQFRKQIEPNDLKNAFKINAFMQVQNISVDEAKERYIEIINQLLKERQL
jgi:acyl-CoA-binding protein